MHTANKSSSSSSSSWALLLAAVAIVCSGYDPRKLWLNTHEITLTGEEENPTVAIPTFDVFESTLPNPKVRILLYDPLVAYIEDFLSPAEREYLQTLSTPLLTSSMVLHANGTQSLSLERTSSTAFLPTSDFVVSTIARRASEFQGYRLPQDIQITSYQPGQRYVPHYDWFTQPERTTNRLSTFFAIVDAACEDCGTQFPNLRIDWSQHDPSWCAFVDCGKDVLTTKNVPGSAWYWRNLHADGTGREDALHAGLPANNGTKVGLNIWTEIEVPKIGQ